MAMAGPTGGFGPGPLTAIDDYWTLDHQRPLRMGRDCPNSNSERVSHKNHASKGNGGKSLAVAASKSPRRHTGLSSCRPVNSAVDVILLARFFVGGRWGGPWGADASSLFPSLPVDAAQSGRAQYDGASSVVGICLHPRRCEAGACRPTLPHCRRPALRSTSTSLTVQFRTVNGELQSRPDAESNFPPQPIHPSIDQTCPGQRVRVKSPVNAMHTTRTHILPSQVYLSHHDNLCLSFKHGLLHRCLFDLSVYYLTCIVLVSRLVSLSVTTCYP